MKTNNITKPKITEKSINHVKNNIYSFYVDMNLGKNQIKEMIENLYEIEVGKIRIMTRVGKTRKAGRKQVKKTLPDRKIALIEVKKGKIGLFPTS